MAECLHVARPKRRPINSGRSGHTPPIASPSPAQRPGSRDRPARGRARPRVATAPASGRGCPPHPRSRRNADPRPRACARRRRQGVRGRFVGASWWALASVEPGWREHRRKRRSVGMRDSRGERQEVLACARQNTHLPRGISTGDPAHADQQGRKFSFFIRRVGPVPASGRRARRRWPCGLSRQRVREPLSLCRARSRLRWRLP